MNELARRELKEVAAMRCIAGVLCVAPPLDLSLAVHSGDLSDRGYFFYSRLAPRASQLVTQ